MNRQYRLASRSTKERAPFPSAAFVLVVSIVLITGFGFYRLGSHLIKRSQMFKLRQIEVVGNNYLDKDQLIEMVDVQPGTRLFEIKLDSISGRMLRENRYLEGVSISRALPSGIMITVQERQPVAYIVDGRVYMVDRDGLMLPRKKGMSLKNLPLITGLSVSRLLNDRTPLLNALDLIDKIKEVDPHLFEFISEIHLNANSPAQLFLNRGGARVDFGSEATYTRLYYLSQFLKEPAVVNELETVKDINLMFDDRIIVTSKG